MGGKGKYCYARGFEGFHNSFLLNRENETNTKKKGRDGRKSKPSLSMPRFWQRIYKSASFNGRNESNTYSSHHWCCHHRFPPNKWTVIRTIFVASRRNIRHTIGYGLVAAGYSKAMIVTGRIINLRLAQIADNNKSTLLFKNKITSTKRFYFCWFDSRIVIILYPPYLWLFQ